MKKRLHHLNLLQNEQARDAGIQECRNAEHRVCEHRAQNAKQRM